ncbi:MULTISPECIES: phosphatidylglycerophosphatase A [unclassified Halomonas]|uniref:phosphatidylglycerophosphatase A family protein n=1 Tax=unclassified Halomonas TaxID=2609666 RepID=UPI0021E470DC|nr:MULTISPECIES: phosphatidylglycerophosphatase A [unclassified Halomonas]UYF98992.1 phosphatidylglycerophosphatase A [Halomonas sp. GD1P12]WNL39890.1 phosphatidylglycerophosphatase A [Halomonas sp. PAMB 3232]WNL43198.1 phosphatidylglycerophosphatase A [Halomonas sp. PAMB 3264]
MLETLNIALASGLGVGFAPLAPGTVGTLWGVALAWWLLSHRVSHQVAISALMLGLGVLVCHYASRYYGGLDYGSIVFDEIVAFPLAVIGLKAARTRWVMAAAFIVYRLLDALKPPPIHLAEFAPGGLGVVLDDAIAALLTWLVMAALLLFRRRAYTTRSI